MDPALWKVNRQPLGGLGGLEAPFHHQDPVPWMDPLGGLVGLEARQDHLVGLDSLVSRHSLGSPDSRLGLAHRPLREPRPRQVPHACPPGLHQMTIVHGAGGQPR